MIPTDRLSPAMVAVLGQFSGWPGVARARVEPLDGGSGNPVLRVRFAHEDLVVRQSIPAWPALKLDGAGELAALMSAASAGVAPALRAGDGAAAISVVEYVRDARPTSPADLKDPRIQARLVEQLKILHGVDFRPRAFDAVSTVDWYLSHAADLAPRFRDELQVLAPDFARQFTGRVFCHNDLMAANVLNNGRLWLIDFEYAVCSDPVLDLAGVAALNGFDDNARRHLLAAYYGDHGPCMAAFNRVCRLVLLMSLAWAHGVSGAPGARLRPGLQQQLRALLSLVPAQQVR